MCFVICRCHSYNSFAFLVIHNLISHGNHRIHDATTKSMPNGNNTTKFMIPPLKAYPMAIVNCHVQYFLDENLQLNIVKLL